MVPKVHKFSDAVEFETDERCSIVELSNTSDDPDVSIARARVMPGVTTAWHKLEGVVERYVIISGRGRVEVGELEPLDVVEGDVVLIPSGVRQRIMNTSAADLIFLAICNPRFTSESYVNLEK